jgi:hypothetical protein
MTKLLEEAVNWLRELPEDVQDKTVRALIRQLEEQSETGDRMDDDSASNGR